MCSLQGAAPQGEEHRDSAAPRAGGVRAGTQPVLQGENNPGVSSSISLAKLLQHKELSSVWSNGRDLAQCAVEGDSWTWQLMSEGFGVIWVAVNSQVA